jgi:hypothetical protein
MQKKASRFAVRASIALQKVVMILLFSNYSLPVAVNMKLEYVEDKLEKRVVKKRRKKE